MTKSKKAETKQQKDSNVKGKLQAVCRVPVPQEIIKEYSAFFGNSQKQELYNFIYNLDLYDPQSIWVENTMDDEQAVKLTKPVGMKTLDHYFNKKGSLKSDSKSKSPKSSEIKSAKSPAKEINNETLSQDIFAENDHDSSTDFVPSTQKSPRKSKLNISSNKMGSSDMSSGNESIKRKRNSLESSPNQKKRIKIDKNSKLVQSPKNTKLINKNGDISSNSSSESDTVPVNVLNDKKLPVKHSVQAKASNESSSSSSESDTRSTSIPKSKSPTKVVRDTQLDKKSNSSSSDEDTHRTSKLDSRSTSLKTSVNSKNKPKLQISSKNKDSSSSSSDSEPEVDAKFVQSALGTNKKSSVSKGNSKSPAKSDTKSNVNQNKDSLSSSSDSEPQVTSNYLSKSTLSNDMKSNSDNRNMMSGVNQSNKSHSSSSDSEPEVTSNSAKPALGKDRESNVGKSKSKSPLKSNMKSNLNPSKDSLSSSSDSEVESKSVNPNIMKGKESNSAKRDSISKVNRRNNSNSSSSDSEPEVTSKSVKPALVKDMEFGKRNSKSPSKSGNKSNKNQNNNSHSSSSDSEAEVNTNSVKSSFDKGKECNVSGKNSKTPVKSSLKSNSNQSKDSSSSSSDSDAEVNTKCIMPSSGKDTKSNVTNRNSKSPSKSSTKLNTNKNKDSHSSSSDSEAEVNTKSVKPFSGKDKELNVSEKNSKSSSKSDLKSNKNKDKDSLSSSSDSDIDTGKTKSNVPSHRNSFSSDSNNPNKNKQNTDVKNKEGNSESLSDSSDEESKKLNKSKNIREKKSSIDNSDDNSSSGLSFKNKNISKMLSLGTKSASSNRHLARASIGKPNTTLEKVTDKKVQDDSCSDSSDDELKNRVNNVTSFEPKASSSFLIQTPVVVKKVQNHEKIIEESTPVSRGSNLSATTKESRKHSVSDSDSDHTPDKVKKPDVNRLSTNGTRSLDVKSSRIITDQNDWFEGLKSKMTLVRAGDKLNVADAICLEDITSDDEIYTLQCPNEVDIESLIGTKISLAGESTFEGKSRGKNAKVIPCESFALRLPSKINLLLPSKRSNSLKLGSFNVKGSIVVSERCEVPGIDESVFSSTCAESSEDEAQSKKHSTPLPPGLKLRHPLHGLDYNKTRVPDFKSVASKKKKKHAKEKSTDEMISELVQQKLNSVQGFKKPLAESIPSLTSKSKKKAGVVIARNHISLDSEDETPAPGVIANSNVSLVSDDEASTERRKKKKHKSHRQGPLPEQETAPVLSEDSNISKKKKKKDKEKLIGQIIRDTEFATEDNKECVEDLDEVPRKKKKKRKHSEGSDSAQQTPIENPAEDELIKPKKKKKKDKHRD